MSHYLAIDLGAESGRALLGSLSGGRLSVEELHRFPNTPVRIPGALYWDILRLWHEIQQGIAVASRERKITLDGIGIDTWGVDYGLLGADGLLIDSPAPLSRRAHQRRDGEALRNCAARPGLRLHGHTVHATQHAVSVVCHAASGDLPRIGAAARLLNIPDLFNYWLTGVAKSETTIASTTQFFNPKTMTWATELLERLNLPAGMLVPESSRRARGSETCWSRRMRRSMPPRATIPRRRWSRFPRRAADNWCYISSGTWSLMGLELDEPVINEQSLAANYTNEVGVSGKIRFLKNIAGLWLLQECRKAWMLEGREYSYEQLTRLAAEARPFSAAIDPDAFLEPGDMPAKIAAYCRGKGTRRPPPMANSRAPFWRAWRCATAT